MRFSGSASRLFLLLSLWVFSATAFAQVTCPQPPIQLREPILCSEQEGEATTTSTAPSLQWSIANGTFALPGNPTTASGSSVRYHASSLAPVQLTLAATDANGCTATESTSIPVSSEALVISLGQPSICSWAPGTAALEPPSGGGAWSMVSWSIQGGTFPSGESWTNGDPVEFRAGDGQQPVILTAYAQSPNGCYATSSVTVPIRTIPSAQISASPNLCAWAQGDAQILPPAEGSWNPELVSWSIQNGSFVNPDPWGGVRGTTIQFRAGDGSQPVILTVYADDDRGCHTTGTIEVPVRSIGPAQIVASENVCAFSEGSAQLQPPAEGQWNLTLLSWQIQGGTLINGGQYGDGRGQTTVQFRAGDGSEPVILT
ncbi:MAG TPA: hypothetical protein VF698_12550, partial [Thermoanaerobaculia bacterium]